MDLPPQSKVQFGRRRGLLIDLADAETTALTEAIAAAYSKKDGSVLVVANAFPRPDFLAGVQGRLPGKPFFTSWRKWIAVQLPKEVSAMRAFSSRIFVSPLEPFEFSNCFWDMSGRFLPDVREGCFPAFTGYAQLGIMAVKVSNSVFCEFAQHLEPPSRT